MNQSNMGINNRPTNIQPSQTNTTQNAKPQVQNSNETPSCFDPRLQKDVTQQATDILKDSASKKDPLELIDENGLFINDLSQIEDEYLEQLEKEQKLLYIEGDNGEALVKYDSDGDGKYDREVTFKDGSKTIERVDNDNDGNFELEMLSGDDEIVSQIRLDKKDDNTNITLNYVKEDGTSSEHNRYEDGSGTDIHYDNDGNRESMTILGENGKVTYESSKDLDDTNETQPASDAPDDKDNLNHEYIKGSAVTK